MNCIVCLDLMLRRLQVSVASAVYVHNGESLCGEHARQKLREESSL